MQCRILSFCPLCPGCWNRAYRYSHKCSRKSDTLLLFQLTLYGVEETYFTLVYTPYSVLRNSGCTIKLRVVFGSVWLSGAKVFRAGADCIRCMWALICARGGGPPHEFKMTISFSAAYVYGVSAYTVYTTLTRLCSRFSRPRFNDCVLRTLCRYILCS